MTEYSKRIVVKIGSNVLTRADGMLDVTRLSSLVDQLAELRRAGVELVVVSSGAVASGRGELRGLDGLGRLDQVSARQLFSAVGQAKLINRYYDFSASTAYIAARCWLRRRILPSAGIISTRKTVWTPCSATEWCL